VASSAPRSRPRLRRPSRRRHCQHPRLPLPAVRLSFHLPHLSRPVLSHLFGIIERFTLATSPPEPEAPLLELTCSPAGGGSLFLSPSGFLPVPWSPIRSQQPENAEARHSLRWRLQILLLADGPFLHLPSLATFLFTYQLSSPPRSPPQHECLTRWLQFCTHLPRRCKLSGCTHPLLLRMRFGFIGGPFLSL